MKNSRVKKQTSKKNQPPLLSIVICPIPNTHTQKKLMQLPSPESSNRSLYPLSLCTAHPVRRMCLL